MIKVARHERSAHCFHDQVEELPIYFREKPTHTHTYTHTHKRQTGRAGGRLREGGRDSLLCYVCSLPRSTSMQLSHLILSLLSTRFGGSGECKKNTNTDNHGDRERTAKITTALLFCLPYFPGVALQ